MNVWTITGIVLMVTAITLFWYAYTHQEQPEEIIIEKEDLELED